MKGFYSPIERLAAESTRGKGTGAEFMTELSKRPGYKQAEVEDRDLQTLMALPKMAREEFMAQLKAKPGVVPRERVFRNDPKDLTYEEEYDKQYHGVTGEPHHEDYTLPGGENYREILLQHPKGKFPGVEAHFGGTPNVLASIRVKDRTGPNGEKILHLEEIQSDWHQQGREKGYAPQGVDLKEQARRAKLQHGMASNQLKEAKERSASIDRDLASDAPLFQDPVVRERLAKAQVEYNNRIMDLMPEVMKAEEAHRAAEQQAKQAIPDAPFKKNWHELALKRMIQHAAENGYDQIAITPGEEQAKRYGLSKHVGMVSYNPDEQHFQAFKPNRETLMNEKGASPERVAELIGKDAATRLMSAPAQMGHHFLEGEDLNVGGEGMKGFYDKMVPKFLNQFGKKYGAQVGTTHVPVGQMTEDDVISRFPGGVHDALRNGDIGAGRYIAQKLEEYKKATSLHSFPITPEMRQDVMKNGISMYAEGGAVDNKAKFLEGSKEPGVMYHATSHDFNEFADNPRGVHFVTPSSKWAHKFLSQDGGMPQNALIMPVHVSAKNPFDYENKKHRDALSAKASIGKLGMDEIKKGKWGRIEDRTTLKAIKDLGHDSVYVKENGAKNLGVFSPDQIKSAIGNRGTYDPAKADITKAKGGVVSRETIKPVAHGIIKERVTVSPNLDAMQYELLSAKHFTKKVK